MFTDQVQRARQHFADANPASRAYYDEARRYLPGGHTRTVLTHAPFPLEFVSGQGAMLADADGHEYIDLLGDYTAGLLGHSERRVLDAVTAALHTNVSVGGIHPAEARLARLMCERFGLDRVRFTNSGTEANLMAITTAMMATGRDRLLVFRGGYHGGVLYFATGAAPWNVPYQFVLAPYNDLDGTLAVIGEHASSLAAVIVEPMLGSGGCLPCADGFLTGLFAAAREVGAVCIADEVMTSRHGRQGLAQLMGATADITTFGKYIGGGFSFGAFGGRAELLDQFDTSPETGRTQVVSHAGTFNNNMATMTAGGVVLGEVFTAEVAEAHTARGDEFRAHLASVLGRHRVPMSVSGFGSMMAIHGLAHEPTTVDQVLARDHDLNELLYFGLLRRGVYIAARGMITIGLALSDEHLATALGALDDTLAEIDELV
jgi:glutamate-1-semialdehyde 2,1-aminomutase